MCEYTQAFDAVSFEPLWGRHGCTRRCYYNRWRFFGSDVLTLSTLVLILQWLLRAASRRPPMRLPRQIRSRKIQVTQTPMFGKPTSDYPVASADPYALGLRSLAPRICSYSVDFRPVPRPRSV